MRDRLIHDPCHGDISLDQLSWHIIDTPQFQRLREIKQLGSVYYVYPGASHNRFEHSIGVAHLAGEMIERIQANQSELDISKDEVQAIRLAGLCHDLENIIDPNGFIGHGPFSHVFDNRVIPQILGPGCSWTHEIGSKMMFEQLIDANHIDISTDQVKLVNSFIDGVSHNSSCERRFLYQVVANKHTALDVDKFDYIVRDTMNVGLKSSYDSSRLTLNCRVIDGDIAYHAKEAWNIYELFHTRYSLHKRVYAHKTCTAIDLMISDAMVAANSQFRFDQAIYDPEAYLWLTDSVIRDIARHPNLSDDPMLAYAQKLVRRILTRDLYRCVDECVIEFSHAQFIQTRLGPEDIVARAGSSARLSVDDIRVSYTTLDFGMKDKNPVSNIYFYGKHELTSKFHMKSDSDTSMLVPRQFSEILIRVYAANSSTNLEIVQVAFRQCIEPLLRACGSQCSPSQATSIPCTPVKRRRVDGALRWT